MGYYLPSRTRLFIIELLNAPLPHPPACPKSCSYPPVSEKLNLHQGADFRLCGWIIFDFLLRRVFSWCFKILPQLEKNTFSNARLNANKMSLLKPDAFKARWFHRNCEVHSWFQREVVIF